MTVSRETSHISGAAGPTWTTSAPRTRAAARPSTAIRTREHRLQAAVHVAIVCRSTPRTSGQAAFKTRRSRPPMSLRVLQVKHRVRSTIDAVAGFDHCAAVRPPLEDLRSGYGPRETSEGRTPNHGRDRGTHVRGRLGITRTTRPPPTRMGAVRRPLTCPPRLT